MRRENIEKIFEPINIFDFDGTYGSNLLRNSSGQIIGFKDGIIDYCCVADYRKNSELYNILERKNII